MWIIRERRRAPRVRISTRVYLEANGVLGHAWSVNISEGGMLLHGRAALGLVASQHVKVTFRLPETVRPLEAMAQVIGDPRGSQVGIRFLTQPHGLLTRYVANSRARALEHPA